MKCPWTALASIKMIAENNKNHQLTGVKKIKNELQ